MLRYLIGLMCLTVLPGCYIFPRKMCQETVHNPFPQLSTVAIAPFINHSSEQTVDGRQFAVIYGNELAQVPGFKIVPMPVVDRAIETYKIGLNNPADVRRLAQILEVDAVVIGVVTDYSPYYPPRCGMHVEWYAANPGFHPIPAGYGLPWGTKEEGKIPASYVFDAEMELAREQLKTQTPPIPPEQAVQAKRLKDNPPRSKVPNDFAPLEKEKEKGSEVRTASHEVTVHDPLAPLAGEDLPLPVDWPDPRGFLPLPPNPNKPPLIPTDEPVMTLSRMYNGRDSEFTKALETYVFFQDDARFGGWQGYLQRSDDFIHFCCYLHIHEMLASRGGTGETRVVWRWPASR